MAENCNNNSNRNPIWFWYPQQSSCGDNSCSNDASNIMYSGQNLSNIDIDSNTDLQTILIAIDTAIGTISGIDWSSFDYSCLGELTSAQEFVETISEYVCDFKDEYDLFVGTTFPAEIDALSTSIEEIESPELESCEEVGVVDTDNYTQILTKILNSLCDVIEQINPSSANWNDCYVVNPAPTTLNDALNIILGQICDLKNNPPEPEYPTFDNENSCLEDPGSTDSLYDTIVKIRTYLCELPTLDINDVNWTSCIANPNEGGGADLLSALNQIVAYLDSTYSVRVVEFDSDIFDVTYSTPGNPCSGQVVTLQDGVGLSDKLVALDGDDDNPDYLLNKMTAGDNIEFDTITTPGEVIINCTAEDILVKADSDDTTAGYLIDKIEGNIDGTNSITITESYDPSTDKVVLTPEIDFNQLIRSIIDAASEDSELHALWCALNCSCPTCPDSGERQLSAEIENVSGSDPIDFSVRIRQLNPTVTFFTSGATQLNSGESVTTGYYNITSTDVPVSGDIQITNNSSEDTLPYNIYITDDMNVSIPGSSSFSGTIGTSTVMTFTPVYYANNESRIVVHIELGSGLTTTTTSSTTTTTTTE